MTSYTKAQIEQIITSVAVSLKVDPKLAIATAEQESGLNPNAVGDNGTSFGLFQLHRGGELGNLTQAQADDPATNAKVALTEFAKVSKSHPGIDPGQLAALAQRPAQPAQYAAKVDALYGKVSVPSVTNDPVVQATLTGVHIPGTDVTIPNPLAPLQKAGDAVGNASQAVDNAASAASSTINTLTSKSFWVRVAFISIGLVVVLIGVAALLHGGTLSLPQPSQPIQQDGSSPSVVGRAKSTAKGSTRSGVEGTAEEGAEVAAA